MAITGSQDDFLGRLRATLPARWFPDDSPVLDAVLGGVANAWASIWDLYVYTYNQTRVSGATDIWLDGAAVDFFGVGGLTRNSGEGDDSYRARILAALFPAANTRAALIARLVTLTGRTPKVFEPQHTMDTGSWSNGSRTWCGAAWDAAGGWGTYDHPYQVFVVAYRALGGGIANVAGWGSVAGGWDVGAIEWISQDMIQGQITDADMYATIAATIPAGTIAWTAISS